MNRPFALSAHNPAIDRTASTDLPGEPWSRRKFLGTVGAWAVALRAAASAGFAAERLGARPAQEVLAYYAKPGTMDGAGAYREFLAGLPSEPGKLTAAIQGLVLHPEWAAAYGEKLTQERRQETHLRAVPDMLSCLNLRQPLEAGARPPATRLIGVCRQFTLLAVAALRAHGTPARARCGFASYFIPGKFEDHWVVECWDEREARWRLVDAQLDALQRQKLRLDFDPLDVPRDRFVVAGGAWQKCRRGEASPEQFGLSWVREAGLWFVAANLVRDLAALNKMEMLPWDTWGAMPGPNAAISADDVATFDEVASLTFAPDTHFAELQNRYRNDARFTVPSTVTNALRGATETVPVGGD